MATITSKSSVALLDIARRINPAAYSRALEAAANSGWEIHEGQAALFAVLSLGLANADADLRILTARGAARATGQIKFTRTVTTAAVTVKSGTKVLATDGRAYLTTADVTFAIGNAGPHTVGIVAEREGYAHNCPKNTIVELGELAPGSDTDTSIVVNNDAHVHGGRPPSLDGHGWDRGITRRLGERDQEYRERVRKLPDTVCPGAIDRLLETYALRFVGQAPTAEWTWSEHEDVDIYIGDDAYLDDSTDGVLLDSATQRGALFVLVPDVGEVLDGANYLDDDAYLDDGAHLDETDTAKAAIASGLLATLDTIKGGGIAVIVVQEGAPATAPTVQDNYLDDVA